MALRYLFGPVSKEFAEQNLHEPISRGECLVFDQDGDFAIRWDDTWESISSCFPIPQRSRAEFLQDREPLTLVTRKKFRFLFVGGTIERKGVDLLLKTYHQVFSDRDDVCLVIKDMGIGTFYRDQTAEHLIGEYQRRPHAPEVEYVPRELDTPSMSSLYAACHCLVHPYRGEGFGLPIAEAMAMGLPAIVTGYGAGELDFCREEHAYLIPARIARFPEKRIDENETVDHPWWAEADQDCLRMLLRHVVENPEEAKEKGAKARVFIRDHFTWDHTLAAVEAHLLQLRSKPAPPRPARSIVRPNTALTRPTADTAMLIYRFDFIQYF